MDSLESQNWGFDWDEFREGTAGGSNKGRTHICVSGLLINDRGHMRAGY